MLHCFEMLEYLRFYLKVKFLVVESHDVQFIFYQLFASELLVSVKLLQLYFFIHSSLIRPEISKRLYFLLLQLIVLVSCYNKISLVACTTGIYFSHFQKLGSLRSKQEQIQTLVRKALVLSCVWCPYMMERGKSDPSLSPKCTNFIVEPPLSSNPYYLTNYPPPNTITLGTRALTYDFWRNKNFQSLTLILSQQN